jgi:hypothetical protein
MHIRMGDAASTQRAKAANHPGEKRRTHALSLTLTIICSPTATLAAI